MRKKSLIIIGAFIALVAFQSCSSKPEEGLLKRYFSAVGMKDNATMSSMAMEPMTIDYQSFNVVSVTPERIEPVTIAELSKKEDEAKKKSDDHIGLTLDAKDAVDVAKDEYESRKTKANQQKVDAAQVVYDREYAVQKELQKEYNEAKTAAAREDEITAFSLGSKASDLPNLRSLKGTVHAKEVEIKIKTKTAGDKTYKVFMRKYELKDDVNNLKHNGRWVVTKFELLG